MKHRAIVARFIEAQMGEVQTTREKRDRSHYGFQELRDLLDFIYGSPPENQQQKIVNDAPNKIPIYQAPKLKPGNQ